MKAEISFDCIEDALSDDSHTPCIEGCYRLPGQDWKIFFITTWRDSDQEEGPRFGRWQSGQDGVQINLAETARLNVPILKKMLGSFLDVSEWVEVHGPDSLQMK